MDHRTCVEARCHICGKRRIDHVEAMADCLAVVEAIVRRGYILSLTYSRSVMRATLMNEFPHTHIGFLISVERGLTVDVPLPGLNALSSYFPVGSMELSQHLSVPVQQGHLSENRLRRLWRLNSLQILSGQIMFETLFIYPHLS